MQPQGSCLSCSVIITATGCPEKKYERTVTVLLSSPWLSGAESLMVSGVDLSGCEGFISAVVNFRGQGNVAVVVATIADILDTSDEQVFSPTESNVVRLVLIGFPDNAAVSLEAENATSSFSLRYISLSKHNSFVRGVRKYCTRFVLYMCVRSASCGAWFYFVCSCEICWRL